MENTMTKIPYLLIAVAVSFTLNSQVFAKEAILDASQVNRLIVDRTMTIQEVKPKKKETEVKTYTAYFSNMGAIRATLPDGTSLNYGWTIHSDGALCFTNNARLRRRGANCGYIVSDYTGVYYLYKAKGTYEKDGKVIGARRSEHILTISNLKEGNQL
jgi:hypothetical protein